MGMVTTKDYEKMSVSSSDFQKATSDYLDKVSRYVIESLFITRSNKVQAVIVNPEEYDMLVRASERAEEFDIALAVDRARRDTERFDIDSSEMQELLSNID